MILICTAIKIFVPTSWFYLIYMYVCRKSMCVTWYLQDWNWWIENSISISIIYTFQGWFVSVILWALCECTLYFVWCRLSLNDCSTLNWWFFASFDVLAENSIFAVDRIQISIPELCTIPIVFDELPLLLWNPMRITKKLYSFYSESLTSMEKSVIKRTDSISFHRWKKIISFDNQ